LNAFLVTL